MDKKYKLVFTFGMDTRFGNKAVIVNTDDITNAIDYVFAKYGGENLCSDYHYNKESLKNGTDWKEGLFEEVQADYEYGEQLIEKYSYEILEELILED